MVDKIKQLVRNNIFDNYHLYLLYGLNDKAGFFVFANRIFFAIINDGDSQESDIDTEFLSLKTNVFIKSVKNNQLFKSGHYSILEFRSDVEHEYFETFIKLCEAYVKNGMNMSFVDFFETLFDLFKKSSEQFKKNALGLYGELKFLEKIYYEYDINLSNNWHISGSNSKYDISYYGINFEIKTSIFDDYKFFIKHYQVFNGDDNYIVVINSEENPAGETIFELVEKLRNLEPFASNLQFQINLAKEMKRISKEESKKFSITNVNIYDTKKISRLNEIPHCISDVEYKYDFELQPSEDIHELFIYFKQIFN